MRFLDDSFNTFITEGVRAGRNHRTSERVHADGTLFLTIDLELQDILQRFAIRLVHDINHLVLLNKSQDAIDAVFSA